MFSELLAISQNPKLFVAGAVATGSYIADAANNFKGWEDLTLKGLLIVAVLYLVREIARTRTENAAREAAREAELKALVKDNTDAMRAMIAAVSRQTEYFDKIALKTLDEQLNHNHQKQ